MLLQTCITMVEVLNNSMIVAARFSVSSIRTWVAVYSLKIVWASCSEHQSYAETQYSSSSVFVTSEDQELINENSPNLPTKVRLTALGTCVGAIFIQIKQCILWLILVQFVQ